MTSKNEAFMDPWEWRGTVELGCWTVCGLSPILYWVHGPAVSQDQFVVRVLVVTISLAAAVMLRLRKWVGR